MNLTKAQKEIVEDRHRFRVVNCGRRFGKTTLAAFEMIGYAVAKKERRVVYYAPTRDDARDILWAMLIKMVEHVITYVNESRLEVKIKTIDGGESLIVLYGWESVQERGKGRGVRNDFIILDEVADYRNFWEGWHEVLRPTLTDTRGEALFISTPKGFNHFYDLFSLEKRDADYRSFHYTTYDNPFIPVDEIAKAKQELTDDRFAQEYLADFRKVSGLVYKEFDRQRHVVSEVPDTIDYMRGEKIVGVDFGYTNPSGVLTIIRDGVGTYWITNEYYKTGKTNSELIEYIKTQEPRMVYPDPAEPDRIAEMKRAGLNVREVNKDVALGINRIRELFKSNSIRIHASCLNLISELETYSYGEKKPDRNEQEVPIKERDHLVDAARYALFMHSAPPQYGIHVPFRPKFPSTYL